MLLLWEHMLLCYVTFNISHRLHQINMSYRPLELLILKKLWWLQWQIIMVKILHIKREMHGTFRVLQKSVMLYWHRSLSNVSSAAQCLPFSGRAFLVAHLLFFEHFLSQITRTVILSGQALRNWTENHEESLGSLGHICLKVHCKCREASWGSPYYIFSWIEFQSDGLSFWDVSLPHMSFKHNVWLAKLQVMWSWPAIRNGKSRSWRLFTAHEQ